MARVLVFGTFDLLHPGHLALLSEAARHGEVTVSLTPDALCRLYKGKSACHSFAVRSRRLQRLRQVKQVIASDTKPESFMVLQQQKPDVIVLGHDQKNLKIMLQKRIQALQLPCRIVVAPAYRQNLYHGALLTSLVHTL